MECNKEEAQRAKEMAETRMQNNDFVGARRIIRRAQRLDPNIEDISKMLAICNVHCTFNIKINGEADWYGILQVNQTADDVTINKQYKKLALLLHPDKNKFFGAESAFKIIGEAQKVLLDKSQRLVHDTKIRGWQQPTNGTPHTTNSKNRACFSEVALWTMCTSCNAMYQCCLSTMDKPDQCQRCLNIDVLASNSARQNRNFETSTGEIRVSFEEDSFGSNNEWGNVKIEVDEDGYKYPASFHWFWQKKLSGVINVVEIWAFYCDVDNYPKYYGLIKKRELKEGKLEVCVTWLDGYPKHKQDKSSFKEKLPSCCGSFNAAKRTDKQDKNWFKAKLPSGCGSFKLTKRNFTFRSKGVFSHVMYGAKLIRKNNYIIYPSVGDVWALYKKWSCKWSLTDLQNCEYQIVEVECVSSSGFKVSELSKVSGHTSVFRREGNLDNVIDVPMSDYLRFSHQIRTYKLFRPEAGIRLHGCLELDPAALPKMFLTEG